MRALETWLGSCGGSVLHFFLVPFSLGFFVVLCCVCFFCRFVCFSSFCFVLDVLVSFFWGGDCVAIVLLFN